MICITDSDELLPPIKPQFALVSPLVQVVSKCLTDGADEYLQMLSLCSLIMQQASHNN